MTRGTNEGRIIGCGNISSVYLENLQNSPLIEVVAVAELLKGRAKARADEFNIENVYKVDELLRQLVRAIRSEKTSCQCGAILPCVGSRVCF